MLNVKSNNALNNLITQADLLNMIYPIGSIYQSTSSDNPSTFLGGTWEPFAQGRVLIGAGTGNDGATSMTFTASQTGGEYILPLNCGTTDAALADRATASKSWYSDRTIVRKTARPGTGERTAYIESLQPYTSVYMFRRTA